MTTTIIIIIMSTIPMNAEIPWYVVHGKDDIFHADKRRRLSPLGIRFNEALSIHVGSSKAQFTNLSSDEKKESLSVPSFLLTETRNFDHCLLIPSFMR